ncbi:zinc finger CCHC domain-containing protein 2 [Lucilia cuprina]|uniref:zinc finger CCHC domain-containing protein 2 n=1 Tax=Lucilia cuprina TaxID=7375 RepID=UPI001F061D57|nr:zinc finger CCHC domain-containing protein 2 [Lucilia cuprina]
MISKSDVIMWFKALESYKRIDTMCTLLNMCLPFELRFLGTCLEELGRRDSQELRGMELRANNPQDLATDMIACQKGEPTDIKVRRKMALYLALIRACNRTNVTEIFRTLESWGELDFSTMTDIDTLKELLLVYTMAANHPVFEFEQHLKFMKIFEKIKENKLVADSPSTTASPPPHSHTSTHQSGHLEQTLHMTQQQMQQHVAPPSQQDFIQQHALHAAMHPSGQHHQLLAPTSMQMFPQGTIPLNYPQSHLAKLIPTADGQSLQHQITTVDGIPHMISSNITIPDTSNAAAAILTHPNAASWAMRQYHQPPPQTAGNQQQMMDHPPQASSPMLSQQSSPASSRATSPNRTSSCDSGMQTTQQQQQNNTQVRNMQRIGQTSLKNIRRPSAETTPPPPMMANELIMPQNMKQIQEVVMNNDGSGNQLQNLIRNGYTRSGNHPRIKSGTYIPPHQQQQQQQQQQSPVNQQHYQGSFAVNTGLSYAMQNMSMSSSDMSSSGHHSMDGSGGTMMSMNSNKSTGSDSGSSIGSSGEISPPETPTLMMNNMTNSAMRMSASSGDIQQTQQQQQPTQKHHQPSQLSYNKQLGLTRLNGRSDKLLSSNAAGGGGGNNVMTTSTLIYAQPQQQQQQQQQPSNQQAIYANEMLMGGGGSTNVMQTSLTNNNAAGSPANVVSSNNNMVGNNTVLISSPSAGGATLGNVISTNSVILQPHQQQYNANPYHAAAAAAAAQHLAATSARPPLMTHNPGMAPPPHNTFRLPGFQLPPNGGELLYPAYHPAGGITFLSGAAPPGAPPVALRTTNSGAAVVSTQAVSQPPTPQQVPPPPQQLQQSTPAATVIASPYTSLTTVGLANKPLSCYNCGSQTHSGRECQEASMEDVTRSAIYKLDYSQAATGAGAGTPTAATTPANQQQQPPQQQLAGNNSASDSTITNAHSQQQKTHDSSAVQSISAVTASAVVASSSATSMAATATAGAK